MAEVGEGVFLDQGPHPHLLLGPAAALKLAAGQHGLLVRAHLGPDLRDALDAVRGSADHLKIKGVAVGRCPREIKADSKNDGGLSGVFHRLSCYAIGW